MFYISDYQTLNLLSKNIGNYKIFNISNKGKSSKRLIEEPKDVLKRFHKQFNNLLQRIIVPDFVMAGVKGSCYVDNGAAHIQNKYFYCTDIKKFFPNSRKERVYLILIYL
ncbi:MAG: hypothetical protein R3Y28_04890 [Candidatus Gastranaerophilales bacterium]